MDPTYSLHCGSFLGLAFRILNMKLVKPKKGPAMETIGKHEDPEGPPISKEVECRRCACSFEDQLALWMLLITRQCLTCMYVCLRVVWLRLYVCVFGCLSACLFGFVAC